MAAKLKIVANTHRPVIDIYASMRAEIAARDWRAVHIAADRREPIDLSDRPRGGRWS